MKYILAKIIVAVIVIGVSVGFVYMIATSNLPDWLKFWLLS